MKNRGLGKKFELQIINRPYLIITGYAGSEEFKLFREQKPKTFINGIFKTRIINQATEIKALPSFASKFPQLKDKMHYAEFRETY